jgi:NAD(P)-dependent dehydrogenase (short-subunit alcohol dehydrogenase family)
MANMLIFGGSRGLGAALSQGVPAKGDEVWLVSRGRPDLSERGGVKRHWIEADLSQPGVGPRVAAAIGDRALDVAIYNAGIWEHNAFQPGYDLTKVEEAETARIIAVNLTSAITGIQALLPSLRRSKAAKIIFIGSGSGLDNSGARELAYTASKFGLRGVTHALRENLRNDRIAVTCINPGYLGTITVEGGAASALGQQGGEIIPPGDLIALVKCLIGMSNDSVVKEIDVSAMTDRI